MAFVNGTAYMDFREATDHLFDGVPHKDLAKELGVSVAAVRQARLQGSAKAHRSPPPDWEAGVIHLATEQIQRYRKLISNLSREGQKSLFKASARSSTTYP